MKRTLFLLTFLAGCGGNAGCSTLPAAHVQSDRAIYDAVADEWHAYYSADKSLRPEDRARNDRALALWTERDGPAARTQTSGAGK